MQSQSQTMPWPWTIKYIHEYMEHHAMSLRQVNGELILILPQWIKDVLQGNPQTPRRAEAKQIISLLMPHLAERKDELKAFYEDLIHGDDNTLRMDSLETRLAERDLRLKKRIKKRIRLVSSYYVQPGQPGWLHLGNSTRRDRIAKRNELAHALIVRAAREGKPIWYCDAEGCPRKLHRAEMVPIDSDLITIEGDDEWVRLPNISREVDK